MIMPIYVTNHFITVLFLSWQILKSSQSCVHTRVLKKWEVIMKKGAGWPKSTARQHGTELRRRSYWWWSKYFVSKSRWQSDLVSLRSSKHQSEAGQIKDPTMRSSLMMMIEPKHLIFSHTKIPSLKILECGVKELPCHKQCTLEGLYPQRNLNNYLSIIENP